MISKKSSLPYICHMDSINMVANVAETNGLYNKLLSFIMKYRGGGMRGEVVVVVMA